LAIHRPSFLVEKLEKDYGQCSVERASRQVRELCEPSSAFERAFLGHQD
jgi:hypothetical protein